MSSAEPRGRPADADTPPALVRHGGSGAAAAWLVALIGWTTLIGFYRLDGGARFEPIDCWVAQTAREMAERGEWLVPRFSGETRMQKSPGPYWAVMLTARLRGQTDIDEVAARLPNALAAVILVVTIFWLTRRVAGDRAAVFAGFAAASSVLVMWWSHRGASDLGLTTLTTVSLGALWIGSEAEPPGPRRHALWLLGYFAAGLGMLYKMPMPLAIVGLPAFLYVLLWNRWRQLWNRWHLVGLALFLLPWLPWAVAVCLVEHAAWVKWKVEFLDRFTGTLPNVEGQGGWKNLAFYLPVPLLYCLPFTLSLPQAIVRAFKPNEHSGVQAVGGEGEPPGKPRLSESPALPGCTTLDPQSGPGVNLAGTRFMIVWFASLLVFFTASTGKEWRYFLPGLPPLFVLLGIELARFFDPQRPARPRRDWLGTLAVWVLLPGALLGGGWPALRWWWTKRGQFELEGLYAWEDVLVAYLVTATLLAVGCGLAAWLYRRRHEHAAFGGLVGTMWAVWLYAWPNLTPLVMSQRPFVDFAEQLARKVPAEARPAIRMAGSQDSRIVWCSNIRYPRVIDQLGLLAEQQERFRRGEQPHRRDLDYEMRRYGETMIDLMAGDDLCLFVIPFDGYVKFLLDAPPELARAGRPLPPLHLWLQTRYGTYDRHYILFGNRPPPFREPELRVPDKLRERLRTEGWPGAIRPAAPSSAPTTASAPP